MSKTALTSKHDGITLRRAALIAGLGYLLMPVMYAEFSIYPKLVVSGNIAQTVQNIGAHKTLFFVAILCYLVTFIEDVVIAWALYVLLLPVNRSLSLLGAWFRLMYTAMGLYALLNLLHVYRLVNTPEYLTLFGANQLRAEVRLLLQSFQSDWSFSLIVFGVHLILIGCLIYRSSYIPKAIGIVIVINGCGWMVDSLRPYLFPNAPLGFVSITFLGELLFMLWLLIWGSRLREPA